MKKSGIITLAIIAFFGLVLFGTGCNAYNGLVDLDEEVSKSWKNVEAQYQRRADLIKNLAETVVKATESEKDILSSVVEARSKATGVTLDGDNITPEKIKQFEAAQNNMSGALSRLMLVVERYPDLKSIPQFAKLQDEISGTENRISTARIDFNELVAKYNKKVRRFPSNIFAGMFGFEKRVGFEAKAGSEDAPDLGEIYNK